MKLEDLKKQNEELEASGSGEPGSEAGEALPKEEAPPGEAGGEAEPKEPQELESWQEVEAEEGQEGDGKTVPLGALTSLRKDLRGKISERDSELETLRSKVKELETGGSKPEGEKLVRPKRKDFDTDDEYYEANDLFDDKKAEARESTKISRGRQAEEQRKVSDSVDAHYERAEKLVTSSGMDPKVFKQADTVVRRALDSIRPGTGDLVVDQLISRVGEGSEKVMTYIGRNPKILIEAQGLLASDPTGMSLAVWLGQQKQRLLNPGMSAKSNAPLPAAKMTGSTGSGSGKSGEAEKKKYYDLHKKGRIAEAYNIKKATRARGVNVSSW